MLHVNHLGMMTMSKMMVGKDDAKPNGVCLSLMTEVGLPQVPTFDPSDVTFLGWGSIYGHNDLEVKFLSLEEEEMIFDP